MDPSHSFFMHCPEMLFIAGESGAIREANPAAERALGALAGRALADLAHPDARDALAAAWQEVTLGGDARPAGETFGAAPVEIALDLHAAGGAVLPARLSLWRGPEGEVHGAVRRAAAAGAPAGGTSDQAPADVRRARELAPAERVLRAILDSLPITIWVMDRDFNYLLSDGKALGLVGLKPGQLVGQNAYAVHAKAADAELPIRHVFAGNPDHAVAHEFGRWWETWQLPLRDGQGEVVAVLGVTLDITEAKRIEEELRAKLALIERQNEVIQELGTPIIEVWEGVLALPVVGLLDSSRAARVMDELLDEVARKAARYAILDLTGVGAVDTATARHLAALAQAVRLLGAQGVITGIRPAVAQTMVQMGLDLGGMTTLSNLREAIRYCARAAQADGRAISRGR